MDIKVLILKTLAKNKEVKVSDITKKTGFSRAYINRFFKELTKDGQIVLLGRANKARYVAATQATIKKVREELLHFQRVLSNINLSEDTVLETIKRETGIFLYLPKNITNILDYAFTEMLNNAIEHSRSRTIKVIMQKDKAEIVFKIIDRGVGIFNNIMKKRGLHNELEAIQDILKGKQTTAPKEHTGEGIFFTSKVADKLIIKGSQKKLIIDNQLNDVFIKDIKPIKGTEVEFTISLNSKRELAQTFKEYTGEAFEFSKTKVTVGLYKMDTAYISRSQARRVMFGLDKFKTIILDFNNVETVGQAFADEVFRVWQHNHPNVNIISQNTNDNIEFMIKRAMKK